MSSNRDSTPPARATARTRERERERERNGHLRILGRMNPALNNRAGGIDLVRVGAAVDIEANIFKMGRHAKLAKN